MLGHSTTYCFFLMVSTLVKLTVTAYRKQFIFSLSCKTKGDLQYKSLKKKNLHTEDSPLSPVPMWTLSQSYYTNPHKLEFEDER